MCDIPANNRSLEKGTTMQNSHHVLEVFEAPTARVRDAIRQCLSDAGFRVASSSPSDLHHIQARHGSAIGITDQQTGRVMEVLLRGAGNHTAVSIHHQTTGVGPLRGATFGDLLRDEVNALLVALAEKLPAASQKPSAEAARASQCP
jgi:hypothetical protein